ncbi:MAG: EAL domain-containing protein [Clostridia bacterium]|nr:EAL domain-containing protein [Clostridia bacterium]
MIHGKPVIALCMTKIYDICRAQLVDHLHQVFTAAGMKLVVFNSFVDFYYRDGFDEGARTVYDVIQYPQVDALLVHEPSFFNKELVAEIVARAKAAGKPVVVINGQREDCFNVSGDSKDAFHAVMNHVIRYHGVQDTAFMAGHREGEPFSVERVECYRQVLAENGIPFDEERVLYGQFWDMPAKAALAAFMENREQPPRAIFCANDVMARAVCDWLMAHGWQVPGDVIVTGYDGLPDAELFSPELTSCSENDAGMAQLVLKAVQAGLAGEKAQKYRNPYLPIFSESCGCPRHYHGDFRELAKAQHQTIFEMETHESQMFIWMDRIMSINDMNSLCNTLSSVILPNSYMCLRADYLANAIDENRARHRYEPKDQLVVIPSASNFDQASSNSTMQVEEMIPYAQRWAQDDTMFILSGVYVREESCGYYAVETRSLSSCMHNLKRVQNTLNIAFNVLVNFIRQQNLRRSVERAAKTNPVTGLPNLKGAVEWYEAFMKENKDRYCISVSVYGMPKFSYISENYGVRDGEEVQRYVSECLKLANPNKCLVAHITDDSFMVLNYYEDQSQVDATIGRATSAFYSQIESFNKQSSKEYYIEVNAGCTVVSKGYNSSLESLIKFANSDMYINRLNLGMGKVVKEEESPRDYYRAFEMLVDKNLFLYHFQPIVNARTGEIFGYEALMRTDSSIGLNPLEILAAAKEYGRLYDIEKATLFNVMGCFADRREVFGDKKVFINTIPGHFLNDHDLNDLIDRHGGYMDRFVFELTEQETMSDKELDSLRRLGGASGISQIAIDDFGTGHSNIVNLLRYAPQIIKIDRYLVSEICKSQNKQLFVRNVVEFAKLNGIMTLAEGVETSNELHQLIDLGVDLIQGYYTGRPQPNPMTSLPDNIRREILAANPTFAQQSQLN